MTEIIRVLRTRNWKQWSAVGFLVVLWGLNAFEEYKEHGLALAVLLVLIYAGLFCVAAYLEHQSSK